MVDVVSGGDKEMTEWIIIIFWIFVTFVLRLSDAIDNNAVYIGTCVIFLAEYIEATIKKFFE